MLPTINGKSLLECSLEDLKVIIDSLDYRENEHIDYKKVFTINQIPKEKVAEKQREIEEFRSDVCAFANADGGYLIFGIDEDSKGIPHEFYGTSIDEDNIDKFELDIKNYLQTIQPRMPYHRFNILKLVDGKYIVIMFIQHDMFAPYVHLEDEKNYRIYKRVGNSKKVIGYSELKNMFSQTMSLEKEVERFRKERIDYYRMQEDNERCDYSKFLLLHFIPDTFTDINYNKPVMILEKGKTDFYDIFRCIGCYNRSHPTIEGLIYHGYKETGEGRLNNNGVAEVFYPLLPYLHYENQAFPNGQLDAVGVWDDIIKSSLENYLIKTKAVFEYKRLFICISILGCKKTNSYKSYMYDEAAYIDRDYLLCNPVIFECNLQNDSGKDFKRLFIEYMMDLGIRNHGDLNDAIKEVYGDGNN